MKKAINQIDEEKSHLFAENNNTKTEIQLCYVNHNFYNIESKKRVIFGENCCYSVNGSSIKEFEDEEDYVILTSEEKRKQIDTKLYHKILDKGEKLYYEFYDKSQHKEKHIIECELLEDLYGFYGSKSAGGTYFDCVCQNTECLSNTIKYFEQTTATSLAELYRKTTKLYSDNNSYNCNVGKTFQTKGKIKLKDKNASEKV